MSFEWLNEDSRKFLSRGYVPDGISGEERIRQIGDRAEEILGIEGYSDKFFDYMGKGFFSLSSPIWANFGTPRGLPISCFNSHVSDTMDSILSTAKEVGIMTQKGGGTSGYFGEVRGRGESISHAGTSDGSVNFMRLFDTLVDVTKQSGVRRGSFAAYLPIDHKDIKEFLQIKTEGHPIQGIFTGVCVDNEWMQFMINGDKAKRELWAEILRSRCEIGIPYLFFSDTVNDNTVDVFKDNKLKINGSNLCSEVLLPSNEEYSFVCDLSSVNLAKYHEWKDTDAVEVIVFLLDAVMTEFIQKADGVSGMERSVKFAKDFRALGLGVLGWHDFLQEQHLAFDSIQAYGYNNEMYKVIQEKAYDASHKLFTLFGASKKMEPYKRANATLMTIAPTTSSSFILGQTSQSIEPYRSNYYVKDLAKTKTTIKNKHLIAYLESINLNTDKVWASILKHGGSVQHLDFLDEQAKNVFKTFGEISQLSIIQQAAARQKYLDQGQSLNLMIHPDTPLKDINTLYIEAWKSGVKTLYYQHSTNAAQLFNQSLMTCNTCEG